MSDIQSLTKQIKRFIAARGWTNFQKPKDIALSVAIETGELLEHFQWREGKELNAYLKKNKEAVSDEIADVAIYLFSLADSLKLDLAKEIPRKLKKQALKYPVPKRRKE